MTLGALTPTQLSGDGDASIEPGEDFLLSVALCNTGGVPVTAAGGGTCSAAPFSLAAGGSCTLVYSFNSSLEGLFQQTLTISTDFGALTVQLRGQAQSAVQLPISGSPARLFLLTLVVATGLILIGTRRVR